MKLVYHLMLALFLRLLLIIYGEWQDARYNVSYTDIDYHVFTDAARYISSGESPYKRSTYRYPPLLAALLLPNIWVHRCFGKVLFALFDVVAGGLGVFLSGLMPPSKTTLFLCLYNPMSAIISTRGSADSVSSALVISSIMAATKGRAVAAGVALALATHFRVYPILFILPLWLSLAGGEKDTHPLRCYPRSLCVKHWFNFAVTLIANPSRCYFLAAFTCALGIVTGVSYTVYGFEFLQESYLYHFTRVDTRHNFSVNFYMYLLGGNVLPSIITFLPQMVIIALFGLKYGTKQDLPFACFCQVYVFVVFNKVITAQYFIWPLSIFPIITPILRGNQKNRSNSVNKGEIKVGKFNKFLWGAGKWLLSVGLWLYSAYMLEFLGQNTFFMIWLCSLLLFGTHIYIIKELINCYECSRQQKAMAPKKSL